MNFLTHSVKTFFLFRTKVIAISFLFFALLLVNENKGSANPNPIDTLTNDGAWCWFGDPRAVYFKGEKEQTFIGWITKDGHIMVSAYNHSTGAVQETLIHANLQVDDHDNPSIFIRKDGRIIVFYSKHTVGPMYRVISDNPEDISSFGSAATFGENVTYPNPFQVGDSILLFYRGINWHPTLIISADNGETWGTPQQFIQGGGSRPYTKYTMDSVGGIHVASTTGHPRDEPANKIFYTYFKDGSFRKADGTVVKSFTGSSTALNIDLNEAEVVYDASLGKGWIWDITTDASNKPVMVYAAFPSNTDHRYYYAGWDGANWNTSFVTKGGSWFPQTPGGANESEPNYSAGISLDHSKPSTVYLSKPTDGVFEIWKYTLQDTGNTWDSLQITKNTPSGVVNVRPYVPINHKPGYFDVLWMKGTYIHYTNYKTGIMHLSPGNYFKYYDFGTTDSPTDTSAIKINESSLFNSDFGFENTSSLQSSDRAAGTTAQRDFISSDQAATFSIKVLNGNYNIKIVQGDYLNAHDNMSLSVNGESFASNINTSVNQWVVSEHSLTVSNNTLNITVSDEGGSDSYWIINSILIENTEIFADSLSLTSKTLEIYQGNSVNSNVTFYPVAVTNKSITWYSKDEAIASVSNGTISGNSDGTTYIVASYDNGRLKDSCKVTVKPPVYVGNTIFDFGTVGSAVATGAVQITEQTLIESSYGWLSLSGLSSRERSISTDLKRDIIFSSAPNTFRVHLENNLYKVTVIQGDAAYPHDNMSLVVNGETKLSSISTSPNEFNTLEFEVLVESNKLDFEFSDDGGTDANWVINAIEIEKIVPLDSIVFKTNPLQMYKSGLRQVYIDFYPPNATYKNTNWSVRNGNIASIEDGILTANNEGNTYLIVQSDDGMVKDSCLVTVNTPDYLEEAFFDFGSTSSPVAANSIQITEETLSGASFGWIDNTGITSKDTEISSDERRDFISSALTQYFQVFLENGIYNISIVQGDAKSRHDSMGITINNDTLVSGIVTPTGQYVTHEKEVEVTNGNLIFGFYDNGGTDINWVVNYMNINKKITTNKQYSPNQKLCVFPNPCTEEFSIILPEINEEVQVTIAEISGKILFTNKFSGNETIQIKTDNLFKTGLYHVIVSTSGYSQHETISVIK